MKKSQNPFSAREMKALQSLLLSDKGVNIAPIVDDICPCEVSRDIIALKAALLLSGRLPAFQRYRVYTREWNKVKCWEITHESLLLGIKDVVLRQSFVFNKDENTWIEEHTKQPDKTSFCVVDGPELFGTFEEARDSR